MPKVNAIAKKDLHNVFKKGDKITITPILYEEDTLIRNPINGVFKDGVFVKIFELSDLSTNMKSFEINKLSDALYAEKGTYKDSIIELEDGRRYPSSLIKNYDDFFEKLV